MVFEKGLREQRADYNQYAGRGVGKIALPGRGQSVSLNQDTSAPNVCREVREKKAEPVGE